MSPAVPTTPRARYRPDIDGLRAVAVLLVLACHLRVLFPGGFVGVDVFFVISGYLITGTILPDVEAGRFSIVAFYERRVRRILPALLVMLAVVTAAAWFVLLPAEMEAYARSLVAALCSSSNVLFWREAGYFDTASVTKPLLHTWSLAVEEQFYLVFPLFLLALRRWLGRWLRMAIVAVAAMSFLVSVYGVARHPPAAFFLAPSRAWELLLGSLLSQRVLPQLRGRAARNAGAAIGLWMVLGSALAYNERTPFPGWAALLPCVGAGLVIMAGETGGSVIATMLSWRPVVFVGLISYSLYLWHWPLLVLQRMSNVRPPHGVPLEAAIACTSFVLATLSWKFVEQPFRKGRWRPGRTAVFVLNGAAVAGLAIAGCLLIVTHGAQACLSPQQQRISAYAGVQSYAAFRVGTCFVGPNSEFKNFDAETCLAQHPGRAAILLAGDSHAAQLRSGFLAVYPEDDILQANASGTTASHCSPVLTAVSDVREGCVRFYQALFNDFLPRSTVRTIVLAARWSAEDLEPLGATIATLQGRGVAVVVVGPSIEFDAPLPRLLIAALQNGRIDEVVRHRSLQPQELDRTMSELAATRWHVPYVSVYRDLCTPECPLFVGDGAPLLFDADHFTSEASVLLVRKMRAAGELP